jgi:hypothetical protein
VLTGSLVQQTIKPTPNTLGAFSFHHALIRETLYEELPPNERGQLHLQVAQGLSQRRANGGEVASSELAHHFLSAQPYGDVEVAVAHAQSAAADALRASAHADAREILQSAIEVLRYHVAPSPEIRAALLLQLTAVERLQADPAAVAHLASAVAIAREHRLGRLLTHAGQLLSWGPDLVAHDDEARSVLEAASEALDADDCENLAIVHATLAWTAPNHQSARRVAELLSQARAFAERTDSAHARAAVDDAMLFFSAGPDTWQEAAALADQIERTCARNPEVASPARRILVARTRLITAMQRGDRLAMAHAIDERAALAARLQNAEARWHHERMLLVKAMNEGKFTEVKADLLALRERAHRLELHGPTQLWGLDYGVFLCRTSDVSSHAARARATLKLSAFDSPETRAVKIRSMVDFGLHEEVAEAIAQMSIAAIEDLPHDRDYLAVLCHLAAGAAAARSVQHCELLLRLLSPYTAFYAVGVSFHCEGSVASYLGLLHETLGQLDPAREQYALGLKREQALGLMPRAALTGFRLAGLMLLEAAEHDAGLGLLEHVHAEAERMGMLPLARAARNARDAAALRSPVQRAQPAARELHGARWGG